MIFDRTMADVSSCRELRKRGMPFTDEEKNILERGMLTINTINRIEQKQEELQEIINRLGYFDTNVKSKSWEYSDIFTEDDLKRIVENNSALRKAFFVFRLTPSDAVASYHYIEINFLEKILFDLGEMAKYFAENYRECNTFYCGE